MELTRSPLALPFPELPELAGLRKCCVRAGYKEWDRPDLTLFTFDEPVAVAGVFTRSACASYEVEMGRAAIRSPAPSARALVVNAGNSNAFSGHKGREAVVAIIDALAEQLDCAREQIFVSSTGVIGVPLPQDKALGGLDAALRADPCSWEQAARAIGTTDTFPKGARASAVVDGRRVDIVGIVKGSGMIAPDMATMLGYIFTNAAISSKALQALLEEANRQSFSCITVDGDTSTSDTVLAFATGRAGNAPLEREGDPGFDAFAAALADVCRQLAQLVVRDGEGARKFITVSVSGAASDESARIIGLSIANSPLVKTAIAGEDANWGRVVMAVGKAGQPAERDKLSIAFGGIWTARAGEPVEGVDEDALGRHLEGDCVDIAVDLGIGEGRARVWSCDLTHGYIAINADYRS